MKYRYFLRSDIGIARKTNQDSGFACAADLPLDSVFWGGICDGMGGLADGEIASGYTTACLEHWFYDFLPTIGVHEDLEKELFAQWSMIINDCSHEIADMGRKNNAPSGTTLSALLAFSGRYYAVQIGDSRIYHNHGGKFVQLTEDHSYVHDMVNKGLMTDDEAVISKQRNVLTRCIGFLDNAKVDFYTGVVNTGDWFLISSDGFHGGMDASGLNSLICCGSKLSQRNVKAKLRNAIEQKKKQGERDNITALIVLAV